MAHRSSVLEASRSGEGEGVGVGVADIVFMENSSALVRSESDRGGLGGVFASVRS